MSEIVVRTFDELSLVDRTKQYSLIRLSGLFGDTIHASTRFDGILERNPNLKWIVIHSYPIKPMQSSLSRIKIAATNLMKYWFDTDRIAYYFADNSGGGGQPARSIAQVMNAVKFCKCQDTLYDCLFHNDRLKITRPNLGIPIPEQKNPKKAVILRRSGWHPHFMKRNRPYSEWSVIERELLDRGFDVYLLGTQEDSMQVTPKVIDYRGKLSVREILEFSADASICICVATFLDIWTQFICPTLVISDPGDVNSLRTIWRLNPLMEVYSASDPNYLNLIREQINKVSNDIHRQRIHSSTPSIIIRNGEKIIL